MLFYIVYSSCSYPERTLYHTCCCPS